MLGASSFKGLVLFVCVWLLGLVILITDTGLCVSRRAAIAVIVLALSSLSLSVRPVWSVGQGDAWSDGHGWNSMQVLALWCSHACMIIPYFSGSSVQSSILDWPDAIMNADLWRVFSVPSLLL